MTRPTRLKSYSIDDSEWGHVMHSIKGRQQGLCWHCRKEITDEDHIISKAEAKTKYYHKECAEFVHLI